MSGPSKVAIPRSSAAQTPPTRGQGTEPDLVTLTPTPPGVLPSSFHPPDQTNCPPTHTYTPRAAQREKRPSSQVPWTGDHATKGATPGFRRVFFIGKGPVLVLGRDISQSCQIRFEERRDANTAVSLFTASSQCDETV